LCDGPPLRGVKKKRILGGKALLMKDLGSRGKGGKPR